MSAILAFTLEQAARVAKVSKRRVSYWASRGVLVPSVLYDTESRPKRYLYSFQDVVGLRTLGILRDQFNLSLQQLRKANDYLRQHSDRPWSELRFWVRGRDLLFTDPSLGVVRSSSQSGQVAIEIDLEPVALDVQREAERLMQRRPEDIGKTERHRNIQSNRLLVKGTRVPVDAILDLHGAGYRPEDIVRAFPSLVLDDVHAILSQHATTAA